MSDGVLIAIIGILAVPLGAAVTWMFSRRKNVADIYSVLTESSQTAVETMQAAMQTLHEELQDAQEKIDALLEENKKMQFELTQLRQQHAIALQENASLSRKVDELTRILSSPPFAS